MKTITFKCDCCGEKWKMQIPPGGAIPQTKTALYQDVCESCSNDMATYFQETKMQFRKWKAKRTTRLQQGLNPSTGRGM